MFNDSCKDSNDFSGARALFGGPKVRPKWGPNRNFDAEGVRKPLGSLLERSWGLLEPKKAIGDRLLGGQEAHQDEISATRGVRPGQHWERKAHRLEIERSEILFASCEKKDPVPLWFDRNPLLSCAST